jgi:FMN phosphatase YigB (HAD superfamily)
MANASAIADAKARSAAMKPIRCLMLDLGGVLTQPQRLDKVDELVRILAPGCPRDVFLSAYFAERVDYDRGIIDGAEYWRRIARALGTAFREGDLPLLVSTDIASWFNMRRGMMDFLGGARGRVGRLVLLSNINVDCARYVRSEAGRSWASNFDELVLSCEHSLLKPEIEIYELALDAAGVLPGETLFVDDSPDNVDGARRAGLSSFRFSREEDFAAALVRDYELRP